MKNQAFLRGLLGFPLGITIGYLITILISLGFGEGTYMPVIPDLSATLGSEINAVILQTVLSGLLGTAFAASSVIWEIDHWSIAKQTGIYFLITAFVMMPVAYFANWMEHSFIGFLIYFGLFVTIFVGVWIAQYFVWRNKVNKINAQLDGKRQR